MFQVNERGHKIFDVSEFKIEKLVNGQFSYVNHKEALALSSWGSPEAAEKNKDIMRYSDDIVEKAKERYSEQVLPKYY